MTYRTIADNANELYVKFVSKSFCKEIILSRSEMHCDVESKLTKTYSKNRHTQPESQQTGPLPEYFCRKFVITDSTHGLFDLGYTVSGYFDERGVAAKIVPGSMQSVLALLVTDAFVCIVATASQVHHALSMIAFYAFLSVIFFATTFYRFTKHGEGKLISILTAP